MSEVLAIVGVQAGQVCLQVDDLLIGEVELASRMGRTPAEPIVQRVRRRADERRGTERATAAGIRAMAWCATVRCVEPLTGTRIADQFFERRIVWRDRSVTVVAIEFVSRRWRASLVKGVG